MPDEDKKIDSYDELYFEIFEALDKIRREYRQLEKSQDIKLPEEVKRLCRDKEKETLELQVKLGLYRNKQQMRYSILLNIYKTVSKKLQEVFNQILKEEQ